VNALKANPSLYGAIRVIEITTRPFDIPNSAKIALLLGLILAQAPNICRLAVPVDKHILKSLQNAVFPCLRSFEGIDYSGRSNKLSQLRPFMLSPALSSIYLSGLYQNKAFKLPGKLNLRHIDFMGSHLSYEAIHGILEICPYLRSFSYSYPATYNFLKGTHFTPAQIIQALHSSRDSLERLSLRIPCDKDYDCSDDDYFAEEHNEYMTTKGVETGQYLGPLTSFSSLKYLSVDQNHLSSEAVLPDCLEKLDLDLRVPLRIELIRHLARASHTLLSLQSIQLRIDDYKDDIDDDDYRSIFYSCVDIDFKGFEFHERVVVEFCEC
jgi:hypothetical protein